MIAIRNACLDKNELNQVLQGELASGEFDSAIAHLDECDKCRSAIESIDRDGHWLVESLDDDCDDPLQNETACQIALWQLLDTPQSPPLDLKSAEVPQQHLGPYRLIRPLGAGGMGTVYLAQHERLKRECAIKILPRERVDQPGWLDRFDREMTAVASIEHTNVVRATDAGHQDGWHYLVMEHLDGLDVSRITHRIGDLEIQDALEIIRQAALGLSHIHGSGLVHRDVKPSNLMLTRDGTVKLLDLGLVLSGDDPLAIDDRLTTVGHLMGTLPYMAPEQLVDSRDVNPKADIYALGATLYRLIAGRPPHQRRGGLAQHVLAITKQDPVRIDSLRDDVSTDIANLIHQMLDRDPSRRPNASDVAEQLQAFCGQQALKRLVRQALRRPATESSNVSILATQSDIPDDRDRNRRRWTIGLMFAFAMVLSGFIFKVSTDRGDLVIQSDVPGLVLAVKQGDEVIDRLRIESDEENRFTLYKGTYVIEIEGSVSGVTLKDDVVTIVRGKDTPVVIEKDQPSKAITSDMVVANDTRNTKFKGKTFSQWVEVIDTSDDPEVVGRAIVAAAALSEFNSLQNTSPAAKAFLRAARKWGGVASATPPGIITDDDSDGSQHFMWHFQEAFPTLSFAQSIEAINDELADGNTRSRLATLVALDRYSWDSVDASAKTVEGKFELGRLLSHCVRLSVDQSGESIGVEIPQDQRDWAANQAYLWAFRLAILRDIDPLSIDLIAKQFKRREPKSMSVAEQLIRYRENKVFDNIEASRLQLLVDSLTNNESYRSLLRNVHASVQQQLITIAMGPKEDPQPNIVPEENSGESVVPEPYQVESSEDPQTGQPLYQGKDLASWRAILNREQDPKSLGDVMRAVEVLTRGSKHRIAVAKEVLRTARQWGGFVSAGVTPSQFGDTDPSHLYMGHFLSVYPNFFAEAGLHAVNEELENGNAKSKFAAIWCFHDSLAKSNQYWPTHDSEFPNRWHFATTVNDQNRDLIESIHANLVTTINEFESDPENRHQANMVESVAVKFRLLTEMSFENQPHLKAIIKDRLDVAVAARKKRDGDQATAEGDAYLQGTGQAKWMVTEEILAGAVELHLASGFEVPWDYALLTLLDPNYYWRSKRSHEIMDACIANAPKETLRRLERRLNELSVLTVDSGSAQQSIGGGTGAGGGFGSGGAFGAAYYPVQAITWESSPWPLGLPFFAEKTEDPEAGLDLLNRVRDTLIKSGVDPSFAKSFETIDGAIATVRKRVEQPSSSESSSK